MSYLEDRAKRKNGLLPALPTKKERKPLNKISPKKSAADKAQKEAGTGKSATKLELDVWFDEIKKKHWGELGGYCHCMECGSFISYEYSRHATAHLLPKKLFKSVATHELNYLILGASCGCHEKSHRIDKFITMRTFPEAARRIKIMMPLLPIDELRLISNQLLLALDKY